MQKCASCRADRPCGDIEWEDVDDGWIIGYSAPLCLIDQVLADPDMAHPPPELVTKEARRQAAERAYRLHREDTT